jgi:hypothetical protein
VVATGLARLLAMAEFKRRPVSAQGKFDPVPDGSGMSACDSLSDISATDDLHAMRTEMEESPIGKRSFCHKSGDRPSAWKGYIQPSFASSLNSLQSGEGIWHQIPTSQSQIVAAPPSSRVSRGPPQSHIG